jgi:hypothetical protein
MEKYQKKLFKMFLVVIVISLLGACNNQSNREDSLAIMSTSNSTKKVEVIGESDDLELIENVRKDILSLKQVYDVAIVKGKKDTLVAYKVKHLYRFRMKQLEQEINQRLEEKYSRESFIISSDLKIYLETHKLINKTKEENFSENDANKELQKIIKLKNELT